MCLLKPVALISYTQKMIVKVEFPKIPHRNEKMNEEIKIQKLEFFIIMWWLEIKECFLIIPVLSEVSYRSICNVLSATEGSFLCTQSRCYYH